MGVNALISQMAVASSRATSKLGDEIRFSVVDLQIKVPVYNDLIEEISVKAATHMMRGLAGEISIDVVKGSALREIYTVGALARQQSDDKIKHAVERVEQALIDAVETIAAFAKIQAGARTS